MSQNPHMRFDDQAFNDENSNDSDNRSFEQILRERVSPRRQIWFSSGRCLRQGRIMRSVCLA